MLQTVALPELVPLASVSPQEVEALLDLAFGADRHGRTAYRIREGMEALPDLSFAALGADGGLLGSLQCWPVALHGDDGAQTPLVLVGPVAVSPERQRGGLGRVLMRHMLDRAGAADPLVLIGDPEYYGRFFGFTADATQGWEVPGPVERRRLLARTNGRSLPTHGMLGPRR